MPDIDRKWRTRHDRPAWWVKFSRFEQGVIRHAGFVR
jgi:hypothetical protein